MIDDLPPDAFLLDVRIQMATPVESVVDQHHPQVVLKGKSEPVALDGKNSNVAYFVPM